MAASGTVPEQKEEKGYQHFRDRSGFEGFKSVFDKWATQNFTSPLYNFERSEQLNEIIKSKTQSGVDTSVEQKELADISEVRKVNEDYIQNQKKINETQKQINEINQIEAKTNEDNVKLNDLTISLATLQEKSVELSNLRTNKKNEYANLVDAFPVPDQHVYQEKKLESETAPVSRELKGSELEEFQFLYRLQVLDFCLMDPQFKALAEKPKESLTAQDQENLATYQNELLIRTERAKRGFDFTCEGNYKVGWPPEPEKQYFNAVQLVCAIDLSKKLDIVTLEEGRHLQQRQQEKQQGKDLWVGNYFKDADSLATASETGISILSSGSVISALTAGGSSTKVTFNFETTSAMSALSSTARAAADTWSMPGKVIKTTGGAEQLFVPIPAKDKKWCDVNLMTTNPDSPIYKTSNHNNLYLYKDKEGKVFYQVEEKNEKDPKKYYVDNAKLESEDFSKSRIYKDKETSRDILKVTSERGHTHSMGVFKKITKIELLDARVNNVNNQIEKETDPAKINHLIHKRDKLLEHKTKELKKMQTNTFDRMSWQLKGNTKKLNRINSKLSGIEKLDAGETMEGLQKQQLELESKLTKQTLKTKIAGAMVKMGEEIVVTNDDAPSIETKTKEENVQIEEIPKVEKQSSLKNDQASEPAPKERTIADIKHRNKELVDLIKEKQASGLQNAAPETSPTLQELQKELKNNIYTIEHALNREKATFSTKKPAERAQLKYDKLILKSFN